MTEEISCITIPRSSTKRYSSLNGTGAGIMLAGALAVFREEVKVALVKTEVADATITTHFQPIPVGTEIGIMFHAEFTFPDQAEEQLDFIIWCQNLNSKTSDYPKWNDLPIERINELISPARYELN